MTARIPDGGQAAQTYDGLMEEWTAAGRPETRLWAARWDIQARELMDAAREVQAAGYPALALSLMVRSKDAATNAADCR